MNEQVQVSLIVAVSGGIDSVVLLDRLVAEKRSIVVAHVNHGIRADSSDDERFVQRLAAQYEVPFVSTQLALGSQVSEDVARQARYAWLDEVRQRYGASAVATAHHEDDIFETIIINVLRGTGWRGLCSLRETSNRIRPLLSWTKADIISFALDRDLEWREDSTNDSFRFLRNRIRQVVMPRLTPGQRRTLRELYDSQVIIRKHIDTEYEQLSTMVCEDGQLSRYVLIMSPDLVGLELLRQWLPEPLETSRLRDLLLFAKTARAGTKWSLDKRRFVVATTRSIIVLSPRD